MEIKRTRKKWRAALVLMVSAALSAVALVEINLPGSISNAWNQLSIVTVNVAPVDTLSAEDEARIDEVIEDQKALQQKRGY
jgi:hypothetical protein